MSNPFADDGALFDPYAFDPAPQVQTQLPPDFVAEGCGPGRKETRVTFKKNGKLYTLIHRDKFVAEDWVLSQVRAVAMARSRVEAYRGLPPGRSERDALIKTNLEL